MSFLMPSVPSPAVPAPPPPPPNPPILASSSIQQVGAQTAAAAAAEGGMGFGGTLQTGAEGAGKPTTTGGKTLLGQ